MEEQQEVNEFEIVMEQMSAEIAAMARGKAIVVAQLATAKAQIARLEAAAAEKPASS